MKPNILQRVWKEVKDANADFYNLRTVISPDTIHDDATRFDFIMLPNDGAMAHLTLVGVFFIPEVSERFACICSLTLTLHPLFRSTPNPLQLCSSSPQPKDITLTSFKATLAAKGHHIAPCVLTSFDHQRMEERGIQNTPSPVYLRLSCPQSYRVSNSFTHTNWPCLS
jgi:hypothetical protein